MEPLLGSVGGLIYQPRQRFPSGFRKGIFRSRAPSSRRFRFRDLPYETVLHILGEFFLLRTYSDLNSSYDVLEFYGYFLKDYDRKNYLIFKSVCASRKYELYYIPCLELTYFEFNNVTTISVEGDDQVLYSGGDEFVFPIKEQLVNVHLTVSILKYLKDRFSDRLTRLDFYINVFNDDVLDLINEFTSLKRLKIICTKKMDFTPFPPSKELLSNAQSQHGKSTSFHEIRPAQVHLREAKRGPKKVRHHHIFSSSPDELDERYLSKEGDEVEKAVSPIRRDLRVPNLRHLEIHRCISKYLFMSNPFSGMPNLRTLRFCHISKLSDTQINILIEHSGTSKLENLYFEKVYLENDFINLLSMKNLKRLSFKNCTYNYNKISKNFRFEKEKKKKKNRKKKEKGIIKKRNKKSVILSFSDSDDSSSDSDSDSDDDDSSSESDTDDDQQHQQHGRDEEGEDLNNSRDEDTPQLRYFEFEYYCGEIFKTNYRTIRENLHSLKRTYTNIIPSPKKKSSSSSSSVDVINNNRLIEGMEERSLDLSFLRNALLYFKKLEKLRLINCNLTKKHFEAVRNFGFEGTNILINKRRRADDLQVQNNNKIYEFYKKK